MSATQPLSLAELTKLEERVVTSNQLGVKDAVRLIRYAKAMLQALESNQLSANVDPLASRDELLEELKWIAQSCEAAIGPKREVPSWLEKI